MDERIYVWCVASIRKELDRRIRSSRNPNIAQYYEADLRLTNRNPECLEIRIDGPTSVRTGTKNEWLYRVEVNILVKTTHNEKDIYHHQKNVAIPFKALSTDISVSELGYPDSSGNYVGCFQLVAPGVMSSEHGQVDPAVKTQQATVEAHYEMKLDVGR